MNKKYTKPALVVAVAVIIGVFFYFDLKSYLSLEYIKSQQEAFAVAYGKNPILILAGFFIIYVLSTALSLPGATILTLAAGGFFGLWVGVLLVSFASTLGATCSFLIARFLLKESVQSKFGDKLAMVNRELEKEGAFYLFTLRLIPAFPFFLINLLMGLTPMKTLTFFLVSQIGMLPGTIVYVNAGTQLAKIDSLQGILSPALLGSFVLLGLFPFVTKKALNFFKKKPNNSQEGSQ